MRKCINIATTIICSFLIVPIAFSANNSERNSDNIKLIIEQYRYFLENKKTTLMKYIAKDVKFYRNFDAPEDYESLYKHVITQNEKCIKLKILPFDEVIASGNKVVALYTLSCIDKFNVTHKKRIISIAEINKHRKFSKFWQVTHDDKEG